MTPACNKALTGVGLNTAFSDVDNADGELTFSVSGNSNIQVAIVNGIATFTPTADWNGSEALTFTATDCCSR